MIRRCRTQVGEGYNVRSETRKMEGFLKKLCGRQSPSHKMGGNRHGRTPLEEHAAHPIKNSGSGQVLPHADPFCRDLPTAPKKSGQCPHCYPLAPERAALIIGKRITRKFGQEWYPAKVVEYMGYINTTKHYESASGRGCVVPFENSILQNVFKITYEDESHEELALEDILRFISSA